MCPGASRIKPEKTIQMRFGRGAQEQRKGNETECEQEKESEKQAQIIEAAVGH